MPHMLLFCVDKHQVKISTIDNKLPLTSPAATLIIFLVQIYVVASGEPRPYSMYKRIFDASRLRQNGASSLSSSLNYCPKHVEVSKGLRA